MLARRRWRAAAAFGLLITTAAPSLSAQPPSSDLEISLLTFGSGEIYWQRYGHNALRVHNRVTGTSVVYNYGMFDFGEKNFLLNFARGRMQYRLAAHGFEQTLAHYRAEGRWILEQPLDLDATARTQLAEFLQWNARPENARYPYDYFLSNCSTRVRDALDTVLGGELRRQAESRLTARSWRSEVARLSAPDGPMMLGMDAGLGPAADHPLNLWQAAFVPDHLAQALRDLRLPAAAGGTRPLVKDERLLYSGRLQEPAAEPPDLRLPFLLAGLLLALALGGLDRIRSRPAARRVFSGLALLLTLVCGLGGLLLAALWGLTAHWGAWGNPNLLLFNPLALLLLPLWWAAARADWRPAPWARGLLTLIVLGAALTALLRLLPALSQQNLHWILLLLPPQLLLLWAVLRRRQPETCNNRALKIDPMS